jgi:hypothetical protein
MLSSSRTRRPRYLFRADELGGQPVRPCRRLVDALDDAAHPPLGRLRHETGADQAFHVVVHALRRLVEAHADLGAGTRLGQLSEHLDAPRLEQRLGLLEPLDVQERLRKGLLCQWVETYADDR